jgi:phage terminase large subunit-like protein
LDRESLETLQKIRATIGEYNFSSQYQRRPIPVGGAIVKLEWLRYYESGSEPKFGKVLQSWDTAGKAGELNDYSVCTTWGFHDRKSCYLLDVYRRRLEFPQLKRAVKELAGRYSPTVIIVEDRASGTQLIQDLKAEGLSRIKPYLPEGTLRSLAITDNFNAGGTQTCTYGTSTTPGYDEWGRLVSAVCTNSSDTNVWGQAFGYDAFDNISKTVPTGDTGITWLPGYNQTNNQYLGAGNCSSSTICYDSNGNLLKDTFHTYTWNQDNHPLTVTNGTSGPVVYDAFGRMAEHLYGGAYTEPLLSPVGKIGMMSGQSVSQMRIPLPGGATYAGTNFLHKDWLGSVRLVSGISNRAVSVT